MSLDILDFALDVLDLPPRTKQVVLADISVAGGDADFVLRGAPEHIQADREVVLAAVEQSGGIALRYAAESLRSDRGFVIDAIARHTYALAHASPNVRCDEEVVLSAIARYPYGDALRYASEELRADKAFVIEVVSRYSCALEHVSETLRDDVEVALAAMKQAGAHAYTLLENAPVALKASKELVLAAVAEDGLSLEHAADSLRADKEVVLTAVANAGYALKYASDALRSDRDVVLQAMACYPYSDALQFASMGLKGDKNFVLAAVAQHSRSWHHISDGLKADSDVVHVVERCNEAAYWYGLEHWRLPAEDGAIATKRWSSRPAVRREAEDELTARQHVERFHNRGGWGRLVLPLPRLTEEAKPEASTRQAEETRSNREVETEQVRPTAAEEVECVPEQVDAKLREEETRRRDEEECAKQAEEQANLEAEEAVSVLAIEEADQKTLEDNRVCGAEEQESHQVVMEEEIHKERRDAEGGARQKALGEENRPEVEEEARKRLIEEDRRHKAGEEGMPQTTIDDDRRRAGDCKEKQTWDVVEDLVRLNVIEIEIRQEAPEAHGKATEDSRTYEADEIVRREEAAKRRTKEDDSKLKAEEANAQQEAEQATLEAEEDMGATNAAIEETWVERTSVTNDEGEAAKGAALEAEQLWDFTGGEEENAEKAMPKAEFEIHATNAALEKRNPMALQEVFMPNAFIEEAEQATGEAEKRESIIIGGLEEAERRMPNATDEVRTSNASLDEGEEVHTSNGAVEEVEHVAAKPELGMREAEPLTPRAEQEVDVARGMEEGGSEKVTPHEGLDLHNGNVADDDSEQATPRAEEEAHVADSAVGQTQQAAPKAELKMCMTNGATSAAPPSNGHDSVVSAHVEDGAADRNTGLAALCRAPSADLDDVAAVAGDRLLVLSVSPKTTFSAVVRKKLSQHDVLGAYAIWCAADDVLTFCGPRERFADKRWECRGDCDFVCGDLSGCTLVPRCKPGGGPTVHSCWRFRSRWRQLEAKESGGFMVQVVERPVNRFTGSYFGALELAGGQDIEERMADDVGLRIFRLDMPNNWRDDKPHHLVDRLVSDLASDVISWTGTRSE